MNVLFFSNMAADSSPRIDELEDLDDLEDESLSERFMGLTEMFPSGLVDFVSKTSSLVVGGTKTIYSFGGSALWIVSTSFTVLALPLIFEVERTQAEEAERQQQRQILLGPGAVNQGIGGPGMGR